MTQIIKSNMKASTFLKDVDKQKFKPVIFGGDRFDLLWSTHARLRTPARGSNCLEMADMLIRFALSRAEKSISEQLAEIGEACTLYDRISDVFAVFHINREKKKIYVVSYGDASKIFPRYDDTVIQCNEHGQIRVVKWTYLKADPVLTNVYCRLNGRTLRLRWTKWSTKLSASKELREVSENKLRKIADELSRSLKTIPEGEVINIWDWRNGTFISVNLPSNCNTLDIILFRTVDFVPNKNTYARVDITNEGCVMQCAK